MVIINLLLKQEEAYERKHFRILFDMTYLVVLFLTIGTRLSRTITMNFNKILLNTILFTYDKK